MFIWVSLRNFIINMSKIMRRANYWPQIWFKPILYYISYRHVLVIQLPGKWLSLSNPHSILFLRREWRWVSPSPNWIIPAYAYLLGVTHPLKWMSLLSVVFGWDSQAGKFVLFKARGDDSSHEELTLKLNQNLLDIFLSKNKKNFKQTQIF